MTATPREFLIGLLVAIGLLGASVAVIDYYQAHKGQANQSTADTAKGEAIAHAKAAQAIPDHAAEIKKAEARADAAEAGVARARSGMERVTALLAAQRKLPVPDPNGSGAATDAPGAPDYRDEVISRQVVLIEAQGVQIGALKASNQELKLALTDEQKRSAEWEAACHARERQVKALEVVLSTRPAPRNWSAGARIAQKMDGSRQIGASARRDLGPAYIEVSGFSDRAELGFGWRF